MADPFVWDDPVKQVHYLRDCMQGLRQHHRDEIERVAGEIEERAEDDAYVGNRTAAELCREIATYLRESIKPEGPQTATEYLREERGWESIKPSDVSSPSEARSEAAGFVDPPRSGLWDWRTRLWEEVHVVGGPRKSELVKLGREFDSFFDYDTEPPGLSEGRDPVGERSNQPHLSPRPGGSEPDPASLAESVNETEHIPDSEPHRDTYGMRCRCACSQCGPGMGHNTGCPVHNEEAALLLAESPTPSTRRGRTDG